MLHTDWFFDTEQPLTTADDKIVQVLEFRHQADEAVLSAWATHFRNHYCGDGEIDGLLRSATDTRAAFLNEVKFPDQYTAPGPSIRAGDFGEILVADFLQYLRGYWVPRTRYDRKITKNSSPSGSDIIGFRFVKDGEFSPKDELAIFESKAQFSGKHGKPRLQDAVNDSRKDPARRGESLSAIKQRLIDRGAQNDAAKVQRFQNPADRPYTETYGTVALFKTQLFDANLAYSTDSSAHPHPDNLTMIVIKGNDMMDLVHDLYERAANEA